MELENNIAAYTDRKALGDRNQILSKKKKRCLLSTLVPIISVLVLALVMLLIFLIKKKGSNKTKQPSDTSENYEENTDKNENSDNTEENEGKEVQPIEHEIEVKFKKLEKEFEILTIPGEIKRIAVNQISLDETKTNGKVFSINTIRKTNYDIYIISEEDADEENKLFFSKMYMAAISIVSECTLVGEGDCQPEKLIDLTAEKKTNNNINARVLNNAEDFKDLPIPLCLFNITDNNFITSLTCPESYPESKKNEMLLDLYFFRPPAIQRANKEQDNITITINDDVENNRKYIRELNGGPCNIYNNFGSICTTEMNTTTDLEGNLIKYDEYAVTNIPKDKDNGYIKIKETHLIDETDNIQNLDPSKYKSSLDKLLPKLKPYMKEDIQFTSDNFTDLYNTVHKKEKLVLNKKRKPRNLFDSAIQDAQSTFEANLFNYQDPGGIEINYNLVNDAGLGEGESLKLKSEFLFDNEHRELVYRSQYSNITYIIDKLSVLSKAGNHLATELYNNLKGLMNNITGDISIKIAELNNLINYYDLSNIFDSTLSLSSVRNFSRNIIDESNNLIERLKELYNGIKVGDLRDIAENLNLLVHNYILNSHSLIKNVFDNLKELGNILKSMNNKLTEITTYYLNYTSSSYVDIIESAQYIFENYYINEKNLILNKLTLLLNEFEESIKTSLEKEINNLDLLYKNLENNSYYIESSTSQEYNQLKENIYNAKKYIFDIIEKIKEYFNEKIGLKENGYFISENELKQNNNSYSYEVTESKEISRKLDNDEFIDKTFDNLMKNFRQNYTNIINHMEKEKYQKFVQDEDVLKDSLFSEDSRINLENRMENLRSSIINKIKEENDYYLENLRTNISKFMNEDLVELNRIISDLDIEYFSEYFLNNISNLYEIALNSSLDKILKEIKSNELLAQNYFNSLYNVINNNYYLKELLKSYKTNEIPNWKLFDSTWRDFKYFNDTLTSKERTNGYINKYGEYIANLESNKKYLDNQLFLDLVNEYKPIISKLKENLQIILNIKLNEEYPDFKELNFFNSHFNTIKEISSRINQFFSDNKFNEIYLTRINNNKNSDNNYINSIGQYINTKHTFVNKFSLYGDNVNDFCVQYKRKLCYGCTNCAWNYYEYDRYCFPLSSDVKNNHLQLKKIQIKDDPNLIYFKNIFNNNIEKISEKINNYKEIVTRFEEKLNLVKEDTLNREITKNYLKPFEDWINSVLLEKYNDSIIKTSYNYYQKIIDERLFGILNDVSTKWNECFDSLISEVDNNYDEFQTTTYEFGIMAQAYETLISENITPNYFDSIVSFQRNEFNYSISYYYNYFIKIVNEAYKYAYNNLPINENGFSDILLKRKLEINNTFNSFINNIKKSFNETISIKKQKYVLLVSEEDFFNIGSKFSDILINIGQSLKNKYPQLYDYTRYGDQYSVVSRYYLESSESGKQIGQFYSPINDNTFVDLNLYKFTDLIINNWIFDKNDFISNLNESLLNLTKDVDNALADKNKTNSNSLEQPIINILKDSLENKINYFYLTNIKDLDETKINNIHSNINEVLNKIEDVFKSEANRLKTTSTSYNSNYLIIEDTIKEFKNNIFNELNNTIFSVLNGFYENMKKNVYSDYIENGLNEYIKEAKKETSTNGECQEFHLLDSYYDIGKIIDENLETITNEYKEKTKKIIDYQYRQYYERIKNLIRLDELKKTINDRINNAYSTILSEALNTFATGNPEIEDYHAYDLNDNLKEEIKQIKDDKIRNINQTILLTMGDNYKVDVYYYSWEVMSFSSVSFKVIKPMCKSLFNYFNTEKKYQDLEIESIVQKKIYSNFDKLLKDVIPTFGEQFFNRIIKYNENFKISSLYNNIKFSLTETLLYYISLELVADVEALPKDLKTRIFNLNDLDLTISYINDTILELLEKKITEFITESRIKIIKEYNNYFLNDDEISTSFNSEVLKKINDSLILANPTISNDYKVMIEQYLKEKLFSSYTKIMNEKTNEIIQFVNEKKVLIKSKLSGFFSLDSDQVLIEVNQKINNTLAAINNYEDYFKSFEIPNSIFTFLNKYGNSIIKPKFNDLNTILRQEAKDKIITNLNENSKNIENLSSDQFIRQVNDDYTFFNENYIQNFMHSINSYGTNNYSTHLKNKMENKTEILRRRLDGSQTEEEISTEAIERVLDQGIETNFLYLLNSINNIKNNIKTLEEFNQIENKIKNYISLVNEKNKESRKLIEENEYEDEIKNDLIEKLTNLTIISKGYYNEINESYYQFKNYLKKIIEDLDNSINNCANITYNEFNKEFEKIVNNTNSFKVSHSKIIDKIDTIEPYTKRTEHKANTVTPTVTDLNELGEFKFDILYKNESIKKLIIMATIINRSRPNNAKVDINYIISNCARVTNNLDIDFKEANYTMDIYYDSELNKINLTMYTFFEKYYYYYTSYLINGTSSIQEADTDDNSMNIPVKCRNTVNRTLVPRNGTEVGEIRNSSFIIVNA